MRLENALKVVYAWQGPKGPIWNTELPHAIALAHHGEHTRTSSHFWWQDDLWMRLFRNKKERWILWANCEVGQNDIFIYPFTLAWRVNFTHYFMAKSGLLEYSHISPHVLDNIRVGKGFILIDLSVEAFVEDEHLAALHNYFNEVSGLPLNKIIYLTGCMNANELYQQFCARRNIPNRPDQRLNIISNPSSQALFAKQIREGQLTEPEYRADTVPEKLFLCWNRRFRSHRIDLTIACDKHGLVDKSYWSLGLSDPEQYSGNFRSHADIYSNPLLELTGEDVENVFRKLPLKIDDETENVRMCEDREMGARKFYENSLVSLVTETNFKLNTVTLTEKSFKPIKEKHPFIIVGVKGSLSALRGLGYKTFGEFWDETYDNIDDPRARMAAIVNICKEIDKWDNEKILDFKRKVKDLLDYNFKILNNTPEEIVSKKLGETMVQQLLKIGRIDALTAEHIKLQCNVDLPK